MARPRRYATEEEREAARAASIAKYRESEKYKAARNRYYEEKGVETAKRYYDSNRDKLLSYQHTWYYENKTSKNAHYQILQAAKERDAKALEDKKAREALLKEKRLKRLAENKAKRQAIQRERYLERLQKRKDERKVAAALKKAAQDNK